MEAMLPLYPLNVFLLGASSPLYRECLTSLLELTQPNYLFTRRPRPKKPSS
jgi:hypothetical protein